MSLAAKTVAYIESLEITQGHHRGEAFVLLPWQRKFIRNLCAPGTSEVAVSMGRGGGKSTLLGAVLCACIDPDGPLFVPRSENLCVATSLQQARITFMHCRHFLAQKHELNKATWICTDAANSLRLGHRPTGTEVRALAANANTAQGLGAFTVALLDEPGDWIQSQEDAMHNAIEQGRGKQEDSRVVSIGVRPGRDDHWFSVALGNDEPGRVRMNYSVPRDTPDREVLKQKTWLRANPSARRWSTLREAIAKAAGKARRDPREMRAFKSRRANMGLSDIEKSHLIDADMWSAACADPPERDGPCGWAIDLGGSRSGSAIIAVWPASGRMESVLGLPAHPPLDERARRDGAPEGLYEDSSDDGDLVLVGRQSPDIRRLVDIALERFGSPAYLACDRWKVDVLADALEDAGVDAVTVLRGMGFRDGSQDCASLRHLLGEGVLHPVSSKLWAWSMSRAITVSDPAGNSKLTKRPGDDLAVASTLAAGLVRLHGDDILGSDAPLFQEL